MSRLERLNGLPVLLCLTMVACGASKPHHTVHGGSPWLPNQPLTPYPNAWFEQPGAATETHFAVVFPDNVLPVESDGTPIKTDIMGPIDGFSPATPILAYFPKGVDPTQLTPSETTLIEDRIAFMSGDSSPIVLIDVAKKKRIPIFAELDANAITASGDRQALIIHPAVRLDFATRYAVAITTALHDADGNPLTPDGQFAKWVKGSLTSSDALWEVSDRLDADAKAFASLGIQKSALALAWDFDTASATMTTGPLTGMISKTLASSADGFGFSIGSTVNHTTGQDSRAARVITGTFQAPSFESGPDPSPLKLDAHGQPVMGDLASWTFTALMSQCAAATPGPAPLLLMGHGVFGTAGDAVNGDADLLEHYCAVGIGADWIGLAMADLGILTQVLGDPNNFRLVTDRLVQAHLNFQVLARTALRKMSADPAFIVNGNAVLSPASPVNYLGRSLGGIEGTTFMSVSPDAQRGMLVVPGAEWSLLMWRSGDFAVMLTALNAVIADKLNLQILLSMSQSLWDLSDPIEFSPMLVGTTKGVLFQESIGDPVVTNVSTRIEMRSIGAQALSQLIQPVYGLTPQDGPLTGLVYTQWSIDPMPLPLLADVPGPSSNGAHDGIGHISQAFDQGVAFLKTGQVSNTCGGQPCIYP